MTRSVTTYFFMVLAFKMTKFLKMLTSEFEIKMEAEVKIEVIS